MRFLLVFFRCHFHAKTTKLIHIWLDVSFEKDSKSLTEIFLNNKNI